MTQGRRDKYFETYYDNTNAEIVGLRVDEFATNIKAQMNSVAGVTLQQVLLRPQPNELELRLAVVHEDGSVISQSVIVRKGKMRWNCAGGMGPASALRF